MKKKFFLIIFFVFIFIIWFIFFEKNNFIKNTSQNENKNPEKSEFMIDGIILKEWEFLDISHIEKIPTIPSIWISNSYQKVEVNHKWTMYYISDNESIELENWEILISDYMDDNLNYQHIIDRENKNIFIYTNLSEN